MQGYIFSVYKDICQGTSRVKHKFNQLNFNKILHRWLFLSFMFNFKSIQKHSFIEISVGDHSTVMFFHHINSTLLHEFTMPPHMFEFQLVKKILSQCAREAEKDTCKPLFKITAHNLTMSISVQSCLCRSHCVCTYGFPDCNGFRHTVNLFECFWQFPNWMQKSSPLPISLSVLTFLSPYLAGLGSNT